MNSSVPDFVKKRENVGFAVFAVLALALGLWGLNALLPVAIAFFILLQSALVKALILGATAAVGGLILLNLKSLYLLSRVLSRRFTGLIIAVAPVDVMRELLKDAEAKMADLEAQLVKVVAVRTTLDQQVGRLEQEERVVVEQVTALAQSAKSGDPAYARRATTLGQRLETVRTSLRSRRQQLEQMRRLEGALKDAKEICQLYVEKKRSDIEMYKQNWDAAQATRSAVQGARSVLGDIGDGEEQWDAATGFIDDQYALALAEVDVLMNDLSGDLVKRDISNMAAIERVEEVRRGLTGVRVDATAAPQTPEAASLEALLARQSARPEERGNG